MSYAAYFGVHSRFSMAKVLLCGVMFSFLAQFQFGRWLLLKFPRLFSLGAFRHGGPSQAQIDSTNFVFAFRDPTQPQRDVLLLEGPGMCFSGLTYLAVYHVRRVRAWLCEHSASDRRRRQHPTA